MVLSVFEFGHLANRRTVCSQGANRQAILACLLLFLLMTLRLYACSPGGRSTHGFHCYSTRLASPRPTVPPASTLAETPTLTWLCLAWVTLKPASLSVTRYGSQGTED